jgi:hypothetical protein
MKPRTHGDRKFTPGKANATSGQGKRHTRAGQTPHLSKANATLHTHPSVAFAPTKCDIRDAEVWHFQTISQMTSQMKSANNFPKTNSNNSTKMRNFHQHGIDTRGRTSGKVKTICPQCNDTRGHKGNKSLSIDLDRGVCYCHHCGYKLYVPDDAEERERQQRKENYNRARKLPSHFRRPVFDPKRTTLSEKLEQYWTQERCLAQRLLADLRITEERVRLPESSKEENCLCFNYFEGGTLINTKYRSGRKHFMMVKGAELIPYNIDAVLDTPECIITEGEFDAAAFMTVGRKDVISVPAGAQSNLNWMDRFVESHFEPKKLIYIAVDEDSSGRLLSQELVRRLGSDRCRLVHFGPECKDANEHLIKYGAESLLITLEQAEEIPLEGVFTAEDRQDTLHTLFENGLQRGAETGWDNLDENCTFETGRLAVWTGRAGEGKSEFIDELVLRLCLRHEWKIGFFSPENMPMEYHLAKLAEKLTGHPFRPGPGMTEALYNRTTRWLTDNVTHILPDSGSYTVDCILEKARQLVRRRGVRILVVDPLNRIDQQLEPGQTELQYITSLLNKLSRFALQHKCLVILVAHPRKVNRNTTNGELRRVEMNDINGSANFGNMADFCFTVDRNDGKEIVTIYIDKVRFKHLGSANTCAKFVYNRINGRYWPCEEDIVHRPDGDKPGPVNTVFDNENWLKNITVENCLFD